MFQCSTFLLIGSHKVCLSRQNRLAFHLDRVCFSLAVFSFWLFSLMPLRKLSWLLECLLCSIHILISLAWTFSLTCLFRTMPKFAAATSFCGNWKVPLWTDFCCLHTYFITLHRNSHICSQGRNPCFLKERMKCSLFLCLQHFGEFLEEGSGRKFHLNSFKKQGFTLSTVRDEEEEKKHHHYTSNWKSWTCAPCMLLWTSGQMYYCSLMSYNSHETRKRRGSKEGTILSTKAYRIEAASLWSEGISPAVGSPGPSCIPAWVCDHSKQTQFWMGSQNKG